MARFKIFYQTTHGNHLLTSYDSDKGLLVGNTFDEQLTQGVDGSSLRFSMLKYQYQGITRILNEAASRITYGTQIQIEQESKLLIFVVQNIEYTFHPDNLQLTFNCIDLFQAVASKIGVGYTIVDDVEDSSCVGVQSIDDWAEQIVRETNLDWTYVAIDEANAEAIRLFETDEIRHKKNDIYNPADWESFDADYSDHLISNPTTLNISVTYSCSDSNAYEALKTLGSQNELILQSDPVTRNFWFKPRKDFAFHGYYVNPQSNLQTFRLQGNGENITTVLNVVGGQDVAGNEITLVPALPLKVQKFIDSNDWDNSTYTANLYTDLYSHDMEQEVDFMFLRQAAATPWLENKLINLDFFLNHGLLNYEISEIQDTLNNKLRIVNGRLINAARSYAVQQEKSLQTVTKLENEYELILAHLNTDLQTISDRIFTAVKTQQLLPVVPILYEDSSGTQYYYFGRYNGRLYGTVDDTDVPLDNTLIRTTDFAATAVYWTKTTSTDRISETYSCSRIATEVLTSWVEAVHFNKKLQSMGLALTELDALLQERLKKLQSLDQIFLENCYKFVQALAENQEFYIKTYKVGVLSTTTEDVETDVDSVDANSVLNSYSTDTFGTVLIDYLTNYFGARPTRQQIINTCADIEATLTQYWSVMRSAGLGLGLYVPETWNCIEGFSRFVGSTATYWYSNYLLPLGKSGDPDSPFYLNANLFAGYDKIDFENKFVQSCLLYDKQKMIVRPLKIVGSSTYRAQTNTDNNYTPVVDDETLSPLIWYKRIFNQLYPGTITPSTSTITPSTSLLTMYLTEGKYKTTFYYRRNTSAGTYNSARGFSSGAELFKTMFNDANAAPDPLYAFLDWLSECTPASTNYFLYQSQHDAIWRNLYAKYPTFFREATYTNTDAGNSYELYLAAKAQLDQLSQPELSYNISAIDLYTYDANLNPLQLKLGDQIRIDYQDNSGWYDLTNKTLREQLFITNITHTLRSDGDYQFTVETRRATDIMVQRFARLLHNGR